MRVVKVFAVVTITTELDQVPHRAAGTVLLDLVGKSATSGNDFTIPLNDRLAFPANDFEALDFGGQARYSASKKVSVSTVDDSEYEGPESFTIRDSACHRVGRLPTAPQITFDPSESQREVTISDNDEAQPGGGSGANDNPPETGGSQSSTPGGSGSRWGGGTSRSTSNHAPKFEEGGETSREIEENIAVGTKVGARVRAIDRDDDRLTYSLRGGDRSSFTINESTGRLYTATSLDREADSRYYLTVVVSDRRGGTDSIEVTIVVTDVDEAPTVTGKEEVSVPEPASGVLANYEANDPEDGEIHSGHYRAWMRRNLKYTRAHSPSALHPTSRIRPTPIGTTRMN